MYSVAPLAKAASDSGTGSRPFLVRGNAHASLDGKGWLLSVFLQYDMCLFTYSDRLTFWSKHEKGSKYLFFFCENQHLELLRT